MTIHDYLTATHAPADLISWSKSLNSNYKEAYSTCPQADWLMYFIAPVIRREQLVKIACACARTALKYVPKDELRPLQAIETAERWAEGKATIEEVRTAAYAASAASAAASAASYAAYYAYAYASYAAYAAAAAASSSSHKEMCQLIRDMLPFEKLGLPTLHWEETEGEYL